MDKEDTAVIRMKRQLASLQAQVEHNTEDSKEVRELRIVMKWLWRFIGGLAVVIPLIFTIITWIKSNE